MKNKHFIIGIVILACGALALMFFNRPTGNEDTTGGSILSDVPEEVQNSGGRIVLVEYGDYQCPACAAYAPIVERITEEYKDSLTLVYRHFPLPQHTYAKPAAYAAESSRGQGKFWEMHNLLYRRQREWVGARNAKDLFVKYAGELGLAKDRFEEDMRSSIIKGKVESDAQGGIRSGVNSTPTFFLEGIRIQPRDYEEFKTAIDNALSNK